MRAAVYHGRRDVRVEDVAAPAGPGPGELLLDVTLASICGTDVGEFTHGPGVIPLERTHPGSGHSGPMVIGHEFLGRVAATGEGVERFAHGDRVVSGAGVSCGECDWCRAGRTNLCARYYTIGLHTHGGLADQVIVPASTCEPVPAACSDRSAVLAQPFAIALHAVARAHAGADDTVVVVGAGGIGSFIVHAAASRGVGELIAVDVDDERLQTALELGADRTVRAGEEPGSADGADVVIEASGTEAGLASALKLVRRGGNVLLVGMQDEPRRVDLRDLTLREVVVTTTNAHICAVDLPSSLRILAEGRLADRVVDRVIPLEAVVDDGLEAMASRSVRGKVVVDVAGGGA